MILDCAVQHWLVLIILYSSSLYDTCDPIATKQVDDFCLFSRPSLTRAETIESCNSDDLVTVLEVHDRKPYKIMDRSREVKKGVMAENLDELIERGEQNPPSVGMLLIP